MNEGVPGGHLALLASTDQQLAESLARARDEATRLLESARAEALQAHLRLKHLLRCRKGMHP
jgi:hypothetical protein